MSEDSWTILLEMRGVEVSVLSFTDRHRVVGQFWS